MTWFLLAAVGMCFLAYIGLAFVLMVRWAGSTVRAGAGSAGTVAHGPPEDHSVGIFSGSRSDPDQAGSRAAPVDQRR